MHIIALFFPIFLISRSNDEFERRVEFERRDDDGEPEGGIVVAELEEEWWVASGVGILKLSVLIYSNTAIFHVQVEVHVEISENQTHRPTFFPLSHMPAMTHFKKHLSSQLFPMEIHERLLLIRNGKLGQPLPPEKSVNSLMFKLNTLTSLTAQPNPDEQMHQTCPTYLVSTSSKLATLDSKLSKCEFLLETKHL